MNFSPLLALSLTATLFSAEIPQLADGRFELELIVEQPRIVTPTGMALDGKGRLFVIESHTHQPKPDYPGPKADIVKIFEDKDGNGSLETISIFGEGYRAGMNLAFGPEGVLYLVHRDGVLRLPDKNGDGKADGAEAIVTLETKEKFPHNGLGGVAFGADGWLYLGFGENLGRAYKVTGSDGSAVSGGGEGGNVFRCRADGSKIELYATGFWNPFSLAFDSAGNLFAVDNDPDGRPPCRLLHVIKHGDYGYQFRYGRSGLHPFVAWDGEIPGTLPMVAGTGEAPSGMLWLPKENRFLVTSWGDNTLESYRLRRVETTFKSEKRILARGDASFRPVALAAAPDGAIYISDWADKEYPVHQKGRIWRLRGAGQAAALSRDTRRSIFNDIEETEHFDDLLAFATSNDPFIAGSAVAALSTKDNEINENIRLSTHPGERLAALLALRRKGIDDPTAVLKRALADEDSRIRRIAMIWTAEKKITGLNADLLAAALKQPTSMALIETYLAAEEILAGDEENRSPWAQGVSGKQLVAQLLNDTEKPEALRALARKFSPAPANNAAAPAERSVAKEIRPKNEAEWLVAVKTGGDAANGRRIFASERASCAKCHQVQGEGGKVGTDLSLIGASNDRAKLLNSLLEPSANVGPLYVTHEIVSKSGEEFSGLLVERNAAGAWKLALADARVVEVPADKVASMRISAISIMPDGLEEALSVSEVRDLLSYLETLK